MNMAHRDVLVPNSFDTAEQYSRFCHLDLSQMGDIELADELNYLRPLLWGLPGDHWLRERVKMLEAEMIKRRGNTGPEFRGRPKPKPAEGVEL